MPSQPAALLHEPVWRPQSRIRRASLPAYLRPWLLDTGSLTERLVAACRGNFRVQVFRQRHARPMLNEARVLGLKTSETALIREVLLHCNDVPWVYARTIIPRQTLTGRERKLAHLRSRSLGAVLFADPSVERGEIELAALTPQDRLYAFAARACDELPPALWGRRALFRLNGKRLLVNEIFLPPLGKFPA
jgi:chorismate lyase